ncbi:hypothetical protein [Mucilaginibacter pedocola]|uniref:Uncharacterized protein n=1 Tax=Mucilaginibacter pedocola TaxID=1792845 RepID=A0A1S9PCA7_9SPHI|nr:hypothetical protein [Mucilaginibacter pedocola]OOQ58569.1 hypothetical protein BC343_07840 [Mucilaginibacter pedocola]
MNKPILTFIALAILFAQGCKLDAPDIATDGTGSSAQSESYYPTTTGSYWVYNNVLAGSAPDTVTIKITGQTQTINGKLYHASTSTSKKYGSQPGLIYYNNHIASLRSNTMVSGVTVDMQILNDTTALGHTWKAHISDSGFINGIPEQIIGTVIEKGVTKTIGGKTFTDVINTQVELQYDTGLGDGFETFTTYHFFMAKGVGLIEIDSEAFGSEIGKERIISYSIK